jgi:hypothetical protein
MASRIALLALLLVGVMAACREPAGGGSSSPSAQPGRPSAPVAPAIETDHPAAERTVAPPVSPVPVAPAIETDHPDAEQTIPLPSQPE